MPRNMSVNGGYYDDAGVFHAIGNSQPVPSPTAYPTNPTQQNTNPYVAPGTVGVAIPPKSYPNASQPTSTGGAGTRYNTGQVVPASEVLSKPLNLPASTPTPVPTPDNSNAAAPVQDTFATLLGRARDAARSTAENGFNRARGIYDEGMGLLKTRKDEFQNVFDTGNENILNSYEKGRGELQTSNAGAETRMANAMRALGLGGSAFVKSEGAQRQTAAKGLGTLNSEKNTNDLANLGQFNENQNWANTQENSLSRSLEDANNARSAAESSSDIGYLQDMGNLFNTILSNQLAVNASAGTKVANPYTVNISDMTSALNGTTPSLTAGGEGTVQNVKLQDQDPTLALLKKVRSGVAGAGLYA